MNTSASFVYTPAQQHALALLAGGTPNILLFGGSRSGKTFLLCCATVVRALKAPGSRHAVIRRHFNGVKSAVGQDTLPKVLRCRFPGVKYEYNRTESLFRFPNRSEIQLIGLDDAQRAEKILGKEFATLYFNECSELEYNSVQTALTRLAQKAPPLRNRAYFDCNPPTKSHWTYQLFVRKIDPQEQTALRRPEDYQSMRLNPADNTANLPPGYLENTLSALSSRQRARFLAGEWLDDVEGALWHQELIDQLRVVRAPELLRLVIGVDPAVTAHQSSDLTGIVAAGVAGNGHFYILADRSMRESPLVWCRAVAQLYRELAADRVVGETNQGGDLIETLLRQIAPDIPFKRVHAGRGKILRAEPVAALYEQGKVHHVGKFTELEEELTSYAPLTATKSPDRLDALVWAVAELAASDRKFVLA